MTLHNLITSIVPSPIDIGIQEEITDKEYIDYYTHLCLTEQCRLLRKKYIEKSYMCPMYTEKYQKYSQKLLCWVRRFETGE
jgi:hypothetical protein